MIRIAGKTIFYKHWVNSRIISYSCFKDKFCFPVSFLEFCGVTSAIRSAKRYLKLTLPGEKIQENVLLKLNSSVSLRNIFIFIKAIEHFCRVNIASSNTRVIRRILRSSANPEQCPGLAELSEFSQPPHV